MADGGPAAPPPPPDDPAVPSAGGEAAEGAAEVVEDPAAGAPAPAADAADGSLAGAERADVDAGDGGAVADGADADDPAEGAAAEDVDHSATADASKKKEKPPKEKKADAQGVVYEVEGDEIPAAIEVPHAPPHVDRAPFAGFGKVFLWRVVDREIMRGLGRMSERVLMVTAGFVLMCSLDGAVHRITRLRDLECVATQTRVKRNKETEVLLLKFRPEAGEPSLVLHLKYSKWNPLNLDSQRCIRILAAARQAHTKRPLTVEQFAHDVALKQVKRLGPFVKDKESYRSPVKKAEAWAEGGDAAGGDADEASEEEPPVPARRPFRAVDGSSVDGEEEGALREVMFTAPVVGGRAAGRAAAAPLQRPVPSPIQNLQVGDGMRVKTALEDAAWRFGTVVGFDAHGEPLVAVGDATAATGAAGARAYPLAEPVLTRGIYTVVQPTYITHTRGLSLAATAPEDAHRLAAGNRVKVSALADHEGDCWAQLPSGGWVPLHVGNEVHLKYHSDLDGHDQLHNARFGLNPGVYDTDVARDVDDTLEKVPPPPPRDASEAALSPSPTATTAASPLMASPLAPYSASGSPTVDAYGGIAPYQPPHAHGGAAPPHHPGGGAAGAITDAPVVVMVRIRPVLPGEAPNDTLRPGDVPDEVACQTQCFGFDKVLWSAPRAGSGGAGYVHPSLRVNPQPLASQEQLLETLTPTPINALFAGYNASILAYGASGSGKTFTILGEGGQEGILQRALRTIQHGAQQVQNDIEGCSMKVSFFELYAEKFRDLIALAKAEPSGPATGARGRPNLYTGTSQHQPQATGGVAFKRHKIRVHPITGHYVEGITQVDAIGADVVALLERAKAHRATAATHGNSYSSRSHAIIQISLVRKVFNPRVGAGEVKASTLSIVDLAGSERARRYRDDNMAGASAINLSLTVLRKVIDSLLPRDPDKAGGLVRPPYRESMLTFLLSESLGGNAVTTIIATVSPSQSALEDTLATLRYASRARRIVNRVKVQSVEEVVHHLQHTSPRIATALRDQYQVLAQRLGNEKKAGEARELWQLIRSSADGSKALEEVLSAVRQRERDEIFQQYGMRDGEQPPAPAAPKVGMLTPALPQASSPAHSFHEPDTGSPWRGTPDRQRPPPMVSPVAPLHAAQPLAHPVPFSPASTATPQLQLHAAPYGAAYANPHTPAQAQGYSADVVYEASPADTAPCTPPSRGGVGARAVGFRTPPVDMEAGYDAPAAGALPVAVAMSPPPVARPTAPRSIEEFVRSVSTDRHTVQGGRVGADAAAGAHAGEPGGGPLNDELVEQLVRVLASSAHRMLSPSIERASASPTPQRGGVSVTSPTRTPQAALQPPHPVSPPTDMGAASPDIAAPPQGAGPQAHSYAADVAQLQRMSLPPQRAATPRGYPHTQSLLSTPLPQHIFLSTSAVGGPDPRASAVSSAAHVSVPVTAPHYPSAASYVHPSAASMYLPTTTLVKDYKSAAGVGVGVGGGVSPAMPGVVDAAIQAVPQQSMTTQTSPEGLGRGHGNGHTHGAYARSPPLQENPVLAALQRYESITTRTSPAAGRVSEATPRRGPQKTSSAATATNIMRYSNTIDVVSNLLESAGYDRLPAPREVPPPPANPMRDDSPSARIRAANGHANTVGTPSRPHTPRGQRVVLADAAPLSQRSNSVVVSPLTATSTPDAGGAAWGVGPPSPTGVQHARMPRVQQQPPPQPLGFVDITTAVTPSPVGAATDAQAGGGHKRRHLREEAEALQRRLQQFSASARYSAAGAATAPSPPRQRQIFYSEGNAGPAATTRDRAAAAVGPPFAPPPQQQQQHASGSATPASDLQPRPLVRIPPPPSFVIPSVTYASLPRGRNGAGGPPMTTAMQQRMEASMQQQQQQHQQQLSYHHLRA